MISVSRLQYKLTMCDIYSLHRYRERLNGVSAILHTDVLSLTCAIILTKLLSRATLRSRRHVTLIA